MILVTGFAPFDGAELNPSYEAVKGLNNISELGKYIETLELPVVFGKAAEILINRISVLKPSAVICVGLAEGRKEITPELIAVNFRNARIPDNEGNQPKYERIILQGQDGIFTRLPIREMLQRMQDAGIPANLSTSAGTYVCNEVMYRLLHDYNGIAGFIHVPSSLELGGDMTIREITRALSICIQTVLELTGN